MKPNAKWGVAGLVLGLAVAIMLPTFAQETPTPGSGSGERTVSTTGIAVVRSSPDEALVGLGVHTEAGTAQQAMADNAERMNDVISALRDAGLGEEDLATSSISLYPRWDSAGTHVDGFTAENQVTATVRDLDRLGSIVDRAVAAGANLTTGVTFQLSADNDGADRALADAVADARDKAELLAAAAGAELGPVVSIAETSPSFAPPVAYADAAIRGEAATPILPQTIESQVSVSVVWSLG